MEKEIYRDIATEMTHAHTLHMQSVVVDVCALCLFGIYIYIFVCVCLCVYSFFYILITVNGYISIAVSVWVCVSSVCVWFLFGC